MENQKSESRRAVRGSERLTKTASRGRRIWIIAGSIILAALAATFAVNAGRLLVIDAPQPSDVILVLAGETDRRPARALQLMAQGYGQKMVIDAPAAARIFGFSEVQLAEKYIQGLPQAGSIRICPIVGLSTREESHDVERCLAYEPGKRILIVTSEFHTRRALSIFRREVRGKTFSVASTPEDTQFGTRWWTHRQWAKTCLDEWQRLIWWSVVERWH